MSFDDYMRDIARIPLLTCDEEIILGTQVQEMMAILENNGIASQVSSTNFTELLKNLESELRRKVRRGLKARNRMISANMRLVVTLAKKAQSRQVHMTIQDLIQEGAIGLARAVEKFEPNRGYKFSTYAYWWVRQGITRAGESQEGTIKVPAHIQRMVRQVAEARIRLSAELMREPSFLEIAEAIGEENPEKIKLAITCNPVVVSLDFKLDSGRDSCCLVDVLNADDEAEIREREDIAAKLDFALMTVNALAESEQEIIKQRYGIGTQQLSVKEMAEQRGMTPQAIRDKQQKIIKKLKFVVSNFAIPAE
jgi:RNA polymerase nonessential primary-like sigma factor